MLRNRTSASGGRIFTTSFENNESRTYLEDGHLSRWTENDCISLFDASTLNRQYVFAGETGDDGGTFFMLSKPEGTGSSLATNYAVYPYSEDVKITTGGVITTTLPSKQHYAENSFGLGDNTMVAVTEDTNDTFLSFKNVGGCLKLQFYGEDITVKSITIKGNNGEKISGKATLTAVYDKAPVVTMADDATTSITLDCGEKGVKIGSSTEEATAFYIVTPTTTFKKGFTVTVKDFENKVFTQTTDKEIVISRNVVRPMAAVKAIMVQGNDEHSADSVYYCTDMDGFELIAATEDKTSLFLQTDTTFAFRCLFDSCGSNRLVAYCDSTGLVERIVANDQVVNILHHADKKKMDIFYKDAEGKIAWIKDVDSPYKRLSSRAAAGDVPYSAISIVNDLSYAVYTIINTYDIHKISPLRKYPHKYARKETYNMRGTVALELIKQILGKEYQIAIYHDVSQIVNVMSDYSKWVKEELYGDAIPHLRKYAIRKTNNGLILAAYVTEVNSLKDKFQIGVKASLANDDVTMGNDMSEYSSTVNNLFSFSKLPTGKEYEFRPYLAPSSSSKYWGGLKGLLDYYKYGESKKYLLLEAKAKLISTNDDDAVLQLKVENARRKMGIIYSEHEDLLNNEYQKMEFEPTGEEIILPGDFEREINWENLATGQIYYMPYVIYDDNVINRLIYSPDTVLSAVITEKDFTFYGEKGVLDVIRNPITGAANITGKTFHASGDDGTRRTTKSRSAIEVSERGFIIQEEIESKSSRSGNYPDITVENAKSVKATDHKDGKYEVSVELDENVSAVYYRAYIKVNDKYYYGEVKKCTKEKDPLREALIKLYESTNGDNWTNNENWCSDKPVTEWYGVKIYENEYSLYLDNNNLTGSINQTFPDDLVVCLHVSDNHIKSINVSGCTSLYWLNCHDNQLTSLDVSDCTLLNTLNCWNNQLYSLNVSGCTALFQLVGCFNQLISLDVSGCTALEVLDCWDNPLTSLNVSGCTALKCLESLGNALTSLNVFGCTALEKLDCHGNQLTSLDVSSCTALEKLDCYFNPLTSLNVSGCTALKYLDCGATKIRSIIPEWFSQLEYFGHDSRFWYWKETIDVDGESVVVIKYEDRGDGWWYLGEPERGYHEDLPRFR